MRKLLNINLFVENNPIRYIDYIGLDVVCGDWSDTGHRVYSEFWEGGWSSWEEISRSSTPWEIMILEERNRQNTYIIISITTQLRTCHDTDPCAKPNTWYQFRDVIDRSIDQYVETQTRKRFEPDPSVVVDVIIDIIIDNL